MPAAQRARLQDERLRGLVGRLLAAGGPQARRLREAGVQAGDRLGLADLPRLPMTEKQTCGTPTRSGCSRCRCPRWSPCTAPAGPAAGPPWSPTPGPTCGCGRGCARGRWAAPGATAGSVVHNAYGYGLFTGGLGIHQGAIELGATVVPVSGGMTARQVTLVRDLRPDILTCTPSYALRLGEALAEAGREPGPQPEGGPVRRRAVDRRPARPHRGAARISARWTSTACPRSSALAWRPSAPRPPTACT